VTTSEEHKTEEHHEAKTVPSSVVNGSDKGQDDEDVKETAAADTEQPASSEAGPSTDQRENADEAKTKEKSGKTKGFMGFLKSKTRSQSKEREQADAQKLKTESDGDDGSKKGDSLEREHKQFRINVFSKKADDKKPEHADTQQPSSDGDKETEKHKTSKFLLFGKKKDKPSEDTDEHKVESKDEQPSETAENVEEGQTKPKEKKWFHFGKKSAKDTSAMVGDAHPYEEPAEEAPKEDDEEMKAKAELEPEKQEAEKPDEVENTEEGKERTAASQDAEVQGSSEAPAAGTDTHEKPTEEKEEPHVEEKSSDVSPGGTLTSETDGKDAKVHKKFSFGIKFGKKQKVAKSESSEDNKANRDDTDAEETPKHEPINEQTKDDEGEKQKKQKLFSFGRLTKSKSKDESGVKQDKRTDDAEQKADDVAEDQAKDEEQENKEEISDATVAAEAVDTQKTESDEQREPTVTEETVEATEARSEEIKTETETDTAVEKVDTEKEADKEPEEERKDETTTDVVPAKDEVNEPEVKKDKKEPKKFSFGIKFGLKKEEKTEDETAEDAAHKQKETKWSPFSKKPAKKASDEQPKVEDEANKQAENDQSDKTADTAAAGPAESVENTDAKETATESGKVEEPKEAKEEKTINIRLPKLFSFGKKEALAEDKNIAQESGAECTEDKEVPDEEAAEAEKHGEEEHAARQTDGDKKEGSKMSAGIRKFFSMGRREKDGETNQDEAVTAEENKDEEAKATADAEKKSSPETKHRPRSKSPHIKFPFEIKFGRKKEKSETDAKEREPENAAAASEGDAGDPQLQQPDAAATSDAHVDSEQPTSKETDEVQPIRGTSDTVAVEEQVEVTASTSVQLESVPAPETSSEPAAAAAVASSEVDSGVPAVAAGRETTTEQGEDAKTAAEAPAVDAGKPAVRGRRFPFPFKFGRRSERAKSAERTAATATEETGSAPAGGRPETVKRMMETSASVPDVHLHATSYDENEPDEEHDKPEPEEAAEDTAAKAKDPHVHLGIRWPHFGGKKSQKAEEPKGKEAVDGNETVESRPAADDTQLSAEDKDSSTPKSKKSLLGKGILRIFSPRRDLHKSLTMDADDREGIITYSVEGEGQVMAADKTASLDSKGRIPKSSTTGADRTETVAVIADSTDADRSEVDGPALGHHLVVVAIDFGTTYSGYAFSFAHDARSPTTTQIHMMRRWEGGDPGVVNQKTPTTILLTPSKQFHSFGFTARDFYHDLDQAEASKWLYFEKFKMNLHHCTVRDRLF